MSDFICKYINYRIESSNNICPIHDQIDGFNAQGQKGTLQYINLLRGKVYRAGVEINPIKHFIIDSNLENEISKYIPGSALPENQDLFIIIKNNDSFDFNSIFSMIERLTNKKGGGKDSVKQVILGLTVIRCIDIDKSKKSGDVCLCNRSLNKLLHEKNAASLNDYIDIIFQATKSNLNEYHDHVIYPYRVTYYIFLYCSYLVETESCYIKRLDKFDEMISKYRFYKYEISYYTAIVRLLDGLESFIPSKPNNKTRRKSRNDDINGLLPYLNGTAYDVQLLSSSIKIFKAKECLKEVKGIILTRDTNLIKLSNIFSIKQISIDKETWNYEVELNISDTHILSIINRPDPQEIYSKRSFLLPNKKNIEQLNNIQEIERMIQDLEKRLRKHHLNTP
jgi:hypothetical protein